MASQAPPGDRGPGGKEPSLPAQVVAGDRGRGIEGRGFLTTPPAPVGGGSQQACLNLPDLLFGNLTHL